MEEQLYNMGPNVHLTNSEHVWRYKKRAFMFTVLRYIAIDCIFMFNNKNIIVSLIILKSYAFFCTSAPCLQTLNYVIYGKVAFMNCTSISFHKFFHWPSYRLSPFLSGEVLLKCSSVSDPRAWLEQGYDGANSPSPPLLWGQEPKLFHCQSPSKAVSTRYLHLGHWLCPRGYNVQEGKTDVQASLSSSSGWDIWWPECPAWLSASSRSS